MLIEAFFVGSIDEMMKRKESGSDFVYGE